MDSQEEALDKQDNKSSKSKKKDLPGNKKSSGFAKLASKVTRKRSLKKEKKDKFYEPVFSSTEDSSSNSISDLPISPADSGLSSCSPPPMSGPTLVPLSKSTSKSEDSLDSGIYSRQKSYDSVDSLGSTGSSGNGIDTTRTVMSYVTAGDTVPATDEYEHHSQIYAGKYDDYWREYQDIRQSIIVQDDDFDKRSVTRTDSGGDEEEDEGEWLRQAGLSDLVSSGGLTVGTQSDNVSNTSARLSTDSITSMTILSTLTRPQREAVLRRITSFNRAQKSRRRPKQHINAVFPQGIGDGKNNQEGASGKPPLAPPTVEVTLPSDGPNNDEKASKSTSLPHNMSGFGDYPRRYSEVTRRPATSAINLTDADGLFSSSLITSAFSTPSLDTGHVVKLDQKGYQRKEALNSIVATESSGGIETLSIQSRSTEDTSWRDNFTEDNNNKSKQPLGYSETADQENLPNFSLVRDRLGITRLSDLSLADVKKVQSLAYIELTALFDLHNIELKRRKFGKVKTKETGLFGIPLTTLLEWDQKRLSNSELKVPLVLRETIMFLAKNGLSDEGILRVPGSAVRIKNLRQELESKFSQSSHTVLLDPNAGWNEARTNDVAALLKQYLRELPNPLLTYEYIDAFQSCVLIPDRKQQLQALNLLIILLNDVHRDSLKILLQFLSKVVAKEEVNKMTLNNVAMIMAPNLFMAKKQSKRGEAMSAQSASEDVKHAAGTSNIVRMLIKYHKLLWTVPTFMLTQVRNMNQAEQGSKKHHSQPKEKMKIKFPGMSKTKDPQMKLAKSPLTHEQFDYEVPKGVIRVKVENHSMTSMAVQLDAKSTAGDVIAKFQKQCERAKQMSPNSQITVITNETHALYEVGGNIFERCLDPGTNMHALTKINPDATWIIKKRSNS